MDPIASTTLILDPWHANSPGFIHEHRDKCTSGEPRFAGSDRLCKWRYTHSTHLDSYIGLLYRDCLWDLWGKNQANGLQIVEQIEKYWKVMTWCQAQWHLHIYERILWCKWTSPGFRLCKETKETLLRACGHRSKIARLVSSASILHMVASQKMIDPSCISSYTSPDISYVSSTDLQNIHPAPRGVAAHTAGYLSSYTLNSSALLWTPRGGGGGGGCRRGCRRRRRRGRRAHAEPSCAQRKLMSCHVTPSWAHRGLMLCQVVPCWAILGPCSAHVGLCWAHLGPILGPSWAHLGSLLGPCCAYVDLCWAYVGLSWPMLRLCWA